MTTFITILILLICVLLVAVVLIQNPKGGGLSSQFASSNQVMGVKKTAETVEKLTWSFAIALIVLSLFTATLSTPKADSQESAIQSQIEEATPIQNAPNMPAMPSGQ